jgi:hypothetical protein
VRTFPTFTSGLEALAGWLAAEGVTRVVMEATGQYWKPVWYVLEEAGFELLLVNARHVKILPGRKTDVCDAAWLAELLEHGLLRGSVVPPAPIRELRDLTRYRKRLVQAHSAEGQRVQKTLEDAGIKRTRSPLTWWTSTGCSPRSPRPGTGWPPSPGWASGRPSAWLPRSGWTWRCSPRRAPGLVGGPLPGQQPHRRQAPLG